MSVTKKAKKKRAPRKPEKSFIVEVGRDRDPGGFDLFSIAEKLTVHSYDGRVAIWACGVGRDCVSLHRDEFVTIFGSMLGLKRGEKKRIRIVTRELAPR